MGSRWPSTMLRRPPYRSDPNRLPLRRTSSIWTPQLCLATVSPDLDALAVLTVVVTAASEYAQDASSHARGSRLEQPVEGMDIILVHGAYHGPWCWDLLTPELERLGHRVTTPEMPINDPTIGAARYAESIIGALDAVDVEGHSDRRPVVVGHSMGGLVIPLVAAARPVERLVFLCAFLPRPGMSANQQREAEPIDPPIQLTSAEWTDLGQGVWSVGPRTATEIFFHDASPELAAWAAGKLRPQSYLVMNEVTPLTEWPAVRSDYILCRDDHALSPAWARQAARERLGVEAVELDGGHSPFLTRPAELARTIDSLIR